MTTTEAVNSAKSRLYISGTDFDDELTDFFSTAVDRLYPKVQKEVEAQTVNATVDGYGEATVDLATGPSTALDDVRAVEATEGQRWYPTDSIYRHGTKLRVRGLDSTVTQLKLYGLKKYVVSGSSVDLPPHWELPVLWYMMSEFYDMLAGNKAKFNVYQQSAGGNAVDDMRAEAEYYETKADRYVEDKALLYGA